MDTVNQRLQEILSYLIEKEEVSPEDFNRKEMDVVRPENLKNFNKIKETVSYLKNYAKIQIVAKVIVDQESVEKEIKETKEYIDGIIELMKKEIKELPKAPNKIDKNNSSLEEINNIEIIEELTNLRIERKNNLLKLRRKIRDYRTKKDKLSILEQSLNDINETVRVLFPEKGYMYEDEYCNVINLCIAFMTLGINCKKLINKDNDINNCIFKYNKDKKTYSINNENAISFFQLLKSKDEILEIADYSIHKKRYKNLDARYLRCFNENNIYKIARGISNKKEFVDVTDKINEIIEMSEELKIIEDSLYIKNMNIRFKKHFRKVFKIDSEIKVPKKVANGRLQLARTIEIFFNYIKNNRELERAYDSYLVARGKDNNSKELDYKHLKMYQHKLEGYGFDFVTIPTNTISVEKLKSNLDSFIISSQNMLNIIRIERRSAKTIVEREYANLSIKAKEILKEEELNNVVQYAEKYYGFTQKNDEIKSYKKMSPNAALIILEHILKSESISENQIIKTDLASQIKTESREDLDINQAIISKMELTKEMIHELIAIRTEMNESNNIEE